MGDLQDSKNFEFGEIGCNQGQSGIFGINWGQSGPIGANVYQIMTISTHDSHTLDHVYMSTDLKTIVNPVFRHYTNHVTHSFIFD